MRRRLVIVGSIVLAALITAWLLGAFSRPGFPVEIRCDHIITRPQVTATESYALILAPDGSVWGWGKNWAAMLGSVGSQGQWNVPRRLEVGSDWMALAAGQTLVVGIKTNGALWGWHSAAATGATTPVELAPGTDWVGVTMGVAHGFAWNARGELWGLGLNMQGEVGNGTTTPVVTFTRLGTNTNWVAAAAGRLTSLGLQADGSLWQWGFVHAGYNEGKDIIFAAPTRVGQGTNWASVFLSDSCQFAAQTDGSTWVWGPNAEALFCSTNRRVPFRLSEKWVTIAGKGSPYYGLNAGGQILCGEYQRAPDREISGRVSVWRERGFSDRTDWISLVNGSGTRFGLTRDGRVWTWGFRLEESTRFGERVAGLKYWLQRRIFGTFPPPAPQSSAPWELARFTTNSNALSLNR